MSRQIYPAPITITDLNAFNDLLKLYYTGVKNGQLDLSAPGTLPNGSIPPVLSSYFTYASSSGQIVWTWTTAQQIWKVNGLFELPASGTLTVTGLTNGVSYKFYPYWDETLKQILFASDDDIDFPLFAGFKGNGTTGYGTADTAINGLTNFTIEIWAKVPAGNTDTQIYFDLSAPDVIGTAGNKFLTFYSTGGNSVKLDMFNGTNGTTVFTESIAINDGFWHQLVVTCAGPSGNVDLYVDGNLISAGPTSPTAIAPASFGALTSMYWHFGACNGAATWGLTTNTFGTAVLSEAAVWNSVLTSSQIIEHYQAGLNIGQDQYESVVAVSTPVSLWPMRETSGTSLLDTIGTNQGTYRGTVTLNQQSSVYGASGTPPVAWGQTTFLVNSFWQNQGHIPLSPSAMSASPAGGGGGGTGGGSGGDSGGCFSRYTKVKTKRGNVRFDELTLDDFVLTAKGTWKKIKYIRIHDWSEPLREVGYDAAGTPRHEILYGFLDEARTWQPLGALFSHEVPCDGKVFDLEVDTDEPLELKWSTVTERSYTLANGLIVHNLLPPEK